MDSLSLVQYRVVNSKLKNWLFICKSVGKIIPRLKGINTGELEKQTVETENNYRLKPLLKNQLQKLQRIKEAMEDSKKLLV